MGLEIRDFYGRLIDGMRAERGTLRSGGDGGAGACRATRRSKPRSPMFSGIVKVDADGTAKVDFDMPDFNGTVRVMAVAWSADKLGHAQSDVIVRDAVALTASGPRFLTLGDEARLDVAVHNVEGPAAAYKLEVDSGTTTVAHRLARPQGRRAPLRARHDQARGRRPDRPTTCTSPAPTASRSSAI